MLGLSLLICDVGPTGPSGVALHQLGAPRTPPAQPRAAVRGALPGTPDPTLGVKPSSSRPMAPVSCTRTVLFAENTPVFTWLTARARGLA